MDFNADSNLISSLIDLFDAENENTAFTNNIICTSFEIAKNIAL